MRNVVSVAVAVLMAMTMGGLTTASAQTGAPAPSSEPSAKSYGAGLYAIFQTNMGTIICKLFDTLTPKTVENFVGLAEGTKEYKDSRTGKSTKGRFYDGTLFHRVIGNFMIQGGDPTGTGRGGPGYNIADEIKASLKFDRPGRLAMANTGQPNTGSSQFFITHGPRSYLDGGYTIFGQVVEGQDVVNNIGRVPTSQDRPIQDVVLEKVVIERVE
jgi:peptidyl-prolyl cis-trans isomerase A (cyclophilin A)